ncbi:MAG: hypothetical protein HY327_11990 [Chloroflexi bacterium]|nr:hypothetical protein [Chloroflexota bacterium]
MTANQRNKLIEMYRERRGGTDAEILQGLDAMFAASFKHTFSQATFDEASRTITQLGAQKPERTKK